MKGQEMTCEEIIYSIKEFLNKGYKIIVTEEELNNLPEFKGHPNVIIQKIISEKEGWKC